MKARQTDQMNPERIPLQDRIPLDTPLVIYIEPSGYCNLKCNFCFQREKEGLIKDIMPFTVAKKCIDDIAKFPQPVKMIRICGDGEPLLNPEMIKIAKYMSEKKCANRIVLVTNGILLTPELSENIVKWIDHIIISVEGLNKEQYVQFSNKEIDYDKFYSGLKYLYECSQHEKCTVCIKIHGDAVKEEQQKKQFFDMYGDICDEINIECLVNLYPEIKLLSEGGAENERFRFKGVDYKVVKKKVCPQVFKGFQIYANGDVTACCVDWKRIIFLGSIKNQTLIDIWHGTKLSEIRWEHLNLQKGNISPCKYCTFNDTREVDYLDDHIDEIKERMKFVSK